jgi:N-acetylglucosamine-6-phosphate deacetylase
MIVLSGASLVLPDRILSPGTLLIDEGRIAEIRPDAPSGGHSASHFAFHGHYIVPGFIDVHVHGVDGIDSLDTRPDGGDAVAAIAERLPRYGVTAFCPTTVACAPDALRRVLDQVRRARQTPSARCGARPPPRIWRATSSTRNTGVRSLPAAYAALRLRLGRVGAGGQVGGLARRSSRRTTSSASEGGWGSFTAEDILAEIERASPDVGIVTLAPELDGGIDLVRWLAARGHRVSLGHSAATYDEALEAIAAGARHATHLFNRMPRLDHRAPGLVGAVLQTDEVAAEIICDGAHVHPALIRTAIAAKRPSRIFAITDATAAAGLPAGSRALLGGQTIIAGPSTALLADGVTIAAAS